MPVPELKLATEPAARMDRRISHKPWSPARWPLGAKVGLAATAVVVVALLVSSIASSRSVVVLIFMSFLSALQDCAP